MWLTDSKAVFIYRNFRPFTRTADYPHGRLPAPVDFSQMGKKESTDYPHWWITHTQKQKKIMPKKFENSQVWIDKAFIIVDSLCGLDKIFCYLAANSAVKNTLLSHYLPNFDLTS